MPKAIINNQEVTMPDGITILQACNFLGVEIPRFCYHERLSIAGNCRMCLVEVEKAPKLVASCAIQLAEGMIIHTNTTKVHRAREGVMEFLLINHPLDCPICDQGGECDLQDQSMAYGVDRSRFHRTKRTVEQKNMGPLIATHMTRCIQCTRCVRFMTEIAGVAELGAINRGENMEITPLLEGGFSSEMSSNIVDLCPVGALTHKPFALQARPWEYTRVETIDITDAVGANIVAHVKDNRVMRIMPRLNDSINEEWITDKARFVCDGLTSQRLDTPYIRSSVDGTLHCSTWNNAFCSIAHRLQAAKPNKIAALVGDLACLESTKALKKLMVEIIGTPHVDCRQDNTKLHPTYGRSSYIFNTGIRGIDQADAILLIGCDPRKEAPLINARIRKHWLEGSCPIGFIGWETAQWIYEIDHLGDDPSILMDMAEYQKQNANQFLKTFFSAKKPMLILGQSALARADGQAILKACLILMRTIGAMRNDWFGFNVLHTAAGRVGALDLGFVPNKENNGMSTRDILHAATHGEIDVLYLLGVDEIDEKILQNISSFVIYQGTHGDRGAQIADIILPGTTYMEKTAIWMNTEGRPQQSLRATFPIGEAMEDWRIIDAIIHAINGASFGSVDNVRGEMITKNNISSLIQTSSSGRKEHNINWKKIESEDSNIHSKTLKPIIDNFYFTNPIARNSAIMAQCSSKQQENQRRVLRSLDVRESGRR